MPRILSRQTDGIGPVFNATPLGPPSPSLTFLVERLEVDKLDWWTHWFFDQMLTFFFRPSTVDCSIREEDSVPLSMTGETVGVPVRNDSVRVRWNSPISILAVRLSDHALNEAAQECCRNGQLELAMPLTIADQRLTSLLRSLENERAAGYPCGRLFVDTIESAISILLVRQYGTFSVPARNAIGPLSAARLRRVLEFMHARLDNRLSLKELSQHAGLNTSQLSAQFKASTGYAPYQYLLRLRIARAKQLLRDPKLSILDVGFTVGFDNQKHFATVFRRIVGATPSFYRRHS